MITATFTDASNTSNTYNTYDIEVRRGETFAAAFTFTGQDFTGYTFKCEVRDIITRRRILQITPTLTDTNVINLSKGPDDMVARPGTYRYDLVMIPPDLSGLPQIDYVKGEFRIVDDVTLNIANELEV